MSTTYPTSQQTFADVTPGSGGTSMGSGNLHSTLHNDANDTLEALQDIVGYVGSPPADSLLTRMAALEAVAPRALFDYLSDVGNSGTSETDLYVDDIPGDTITDSGIKLSAHYAGEFVTSATATRELRVYLAGTVIFDSTALILSLSSAWTIRVEIISSDTTKARYAVTMNTLGTTDDSFTSVGEVSALDFSNDIELKITGEASGTGAASDDIVAKLGSVILTPKAV